ncbi:MAG: HNH endonuclease [Planctomycetes bacterium]|nr:HNH endonuclease [Planctomycetota bacterium]
MSQTQLAVEDAVLLQGLSAEAIAERLRAAIRQADVGQRSAAFYLAELHDRRLHLALGMPSTVAYAVRVLGLSRRKARELLQTGLRLRELKAIDAAFAESQLAWSRVRRICEVATPSTEREWLDRALGCGQDELDQLVKRAHRGDSPPKGEGLPQLRFALHVELDSVQWQMWEQSREKLRAELGDDDQLRDVDLLLEMLRLVLASDADGSVPGRRPVDGGPFRVILREPVSETEAATQMEPAEGEVPVSRIEFEAVPSDHATPPALRTRVLARDGHACANCRGRRGLHAHHVIWRSKGGESSLRNLVTLCSRCHALVHEGFLDVQLATTDDPGAPARFEFRDERGRPLTRRVFQEPRIVQAEVAQCATDQVRETPVRAGPDLEWLASHMHWFKFRVGHFALRPAYRERFAEEFPDA